jgi:hypothetical protein
MVDWVLCILGGTLVTVVGFIAGYSVGWKEGRRERDA